MKKLKVAIICKYFYPVAAGIETNTLETYSVLARRSWDVTAHTSKDNLSEKNIYNYNETYRGIKIVRYDFGKLSYWPKLNWQQLDAIALHNFNIIPHLYIILLTAWLKLIGQKKYALFLTPHGGYNPEWSVFPPKTAAIKQFYHFKIAVPLINWFIDGIRAVSNWEKSEMVKKGLNPDKIAVIENGIEDEAYLDVDKIASKEIKTKVKSYGKYLIQVGRVYPIKNYETTIRALKLLPSNINYVIAGPLDYVMGKATYKEKLEKLAKELGVEKRVFFIGVVRGIDKYYLIKKAKMMVHMALWESFCNVVHEGLSQGLVCIVANNTALPYLIKDGVNGYCVETLDYKTLAEKINFVLKNENTKFIKDMKIRNRKFGLEESWQSTAEKMDQFYKSKIKQSK